MEKNIENCDFFIENERFSPLVSFYARRLKCDTAFADLWAFLWELVTYKNPPNDRYICVCLRNEYIRMSKAENGNKNLPLRDLVFFAPIIDYALDVSYALSKLTHKQEAILRLHYLGGYSVSDISKLCGVSRQAINQNRKKGLQKMRDILGNKYLH